MRLSNKHLNRFLADYGMSVVLLLLCVLFTFATVKEQQPTGEPAVDGRAHHRQRRRRNALPDVQ